MELLELLVLFDSADVFHEHFTREAFSLFMVGLLIILVLVYSIFALVCSEESIAPSTLSAPKQRRV